MRQLSIFDEKGYSSKNIVDQFKNEAIQLNCYNKYDYLKKIPIKSNEVVLFIIYDYVDIFKGITVVNNFNIFFLLHTAFI